MQTIQYINELEKNLVNLKKESRENIIKEIQSYIDESDSTYFKLCENFGTPEELANSYLEYTPIEETTKSKSIKYGGKILKILGILLLTLIVTIGSIVYFTIKDDFDYSKYNASTITTKTDKLWVKATNIKNIKIEQSKVVVYWSDTNELKYSCKGENNKQQNDTLVIKQSECYIIVPKKEIVIDGYQSNIVAVEPISNINFNLEQCILKIAENEKTYSYDTDLTQSDIYDFESQKSGINIKIKAYQSKISDYEF